MRLFADAEGQWLPPIGTINSTLLFVCPACGAAIAEASHSMTARDSHEQFHQTFTLRTLL